MKYIEINKKYSEIVTSYLTAGYVINTTTMCGSEGERAKIDLTNGNEIIRVLVRNTFDELTFLDGIEIVIGRCNEKFVTPNSSEERGDIWNDRLEVIDTVRYHKIGFDREARQTIYEAC